MSETHYTSKKAKMIEKIYESTCEVKRLIAQAEGWMDCYQKNVLEPCQEKILNEMLENLSDAYDKAKKLKESMEYSSEFELLE